MNGWTLAAFLAGWIIGAWAGVRGGRKQVIAQLKTAIPGLTADIMKRLPSGDITIQIMDTDGEIVAEGTTKKPDTSGLH